MFQKWKGYIMTFISRVHTIVLLVCLIAGDSRGLQASWLWSSAPQPVQNPNITIYNSSELKVNVCDLNNISIATLLPQQSVTVTRPQKTPLTSYSGKSVGSAAGGYSILATDRKGSQHKATLIAPVSFGTYDITYTFLGFKITHLLGGHTGYTNVPVKNAAQMRQEALDVTQGQEAPGKAKAIKIYFIDQILKEYPAQISDCNGQPLATVTYNHYIELPALTQHQGSFFNGFSAKGSYIITIDINGIKARAELNGAHVTSAKSNHFVIESSFNQTTFAQFLAGAQAATKQGNNGLVAKLDAALTVHEATSLNIDAVKECSPASATQQRPALPIDPRAQELNSGVQARVPVVPTVVPTPSAEPQAGALSEKAQQYAKMLKNGVPIGAVLQRMKANGDDQAAITAELIAAQVSHYQELRVALAPAQAAPRPATPRPAALPRQQPASAGQGTPSLLSILQNNPRFQATQKANQRDSSAEADAEEDDWTAGR